MEIHCINEICMGFEFKLCEQVTVADGASINVKNESQSVLFVNTLNGIFSTIAPFGDVYLFDVSSPRRQ